MLSFVLTKIKNQNQLSQDLKREAKEQGFSPVGITRIDNNERIQLRTAALQRWLNQGYQAEMQWMSAPRRQKIESLLNGVTSLLSVGLNYYVKERKQPEALSIGRYGWGKDYHKIIEKKLITLNNYNQQKGYNKN